MKLATIVSLSAFNFIEEVAIRVSLIDANLNSLKVYHSARSYLCHFHDFKFYLGGMLGSCMHASRPLTSTRKNIIHTCFSLGPYLGKCFAYRQNWRKRNHRM